MFIDCIFFNNTVPNTSTWVPADSVKLIRTNGKSMKLSNNIPTPGK